MHRPYVLGVCGIMLLDHRSPYARLLVRLRGHTPLPLPSGLLQLTLFTPLRRFFDYPIEWLSARPGGVKILTIIFNTYENWV